jgi:hypothetical protein
MRAFRVGDQFRGNNSGLIAEVTWVDPCTNNPTSSYLLSHAAKKDGN